MPNYKLIIETEEETTELPITLNERVLTGSGSSLKWLMLSSGEANANKPYRDREWLSTTYHTENKTLQQIADMCGVSPMTINQWLVKHNIPSRSRGRRQPLD